MVCRGAANDNTPALLESAPEGPIWEPKSDDASSSNELVRCAMNVMYNDEGLYIVEYPGHDAIEVIDKRLGRGMVIRSEAALRFRLELGRAGAEREGSGRWTIAWTISVAC